MPKGLLTVLFSLIATVGLLAQTTVTSPNTILAQLGARGICTTSDGTTNYAGFIVKLASNGRFDASTMAMDMPTNINVQTLNNLYFIDSVKGTNTTTAGSSILPYQTLNYVLTQLTTNAILIFSPGEYAGATTAITNTKITELTLIGYNAGSTIINTAGSYSLTFNNSQNTIINLSGITVAGIRQDNNVLTTINAYDSAVLTSFSRGYSMSNSFTTLNCDPLSTLPIVTSYATNIWSHNATKIFFIPANTNNWSGSIPSTVYAALNNLAAQTAIISPGTTDGSLMYWKTDQWRNDLSGETYQILFGGTSPTFGVLNLTGAVYGPYTNTVLQTNVVDTLNIKDNAVGTNKLSAEVRNLMLTTTTPFGGDTTNIYSNLYVTGIRHITIPVPVASNDISVLVYGNTLTNFTWQPYPGVGSVTNWSKYSALQLVNLNGYGLTNVVEITLNGQRITNWTSTGITNLTVTPIFGSSNNAYIQNNTNIVVEFNTNVSVVSVATWSQYPATQDVNLANNSLIDVRDMTLGGVNRTNWPADGIPGPAGTAATINIAWVSNAPPGSDAIVTNVGNSNAASFGFILPIGSNGLPGIQGPPGTNGSDAVASNWSQYPATQTVDIGNNSLANVHEITLGGESRTNWPTGGEGIVSNWAQYPANFNVDIGTNSVILGGESRTNWPADGTKGDPGLSLSWKGDWDSNTVYSTNDAISYLGSSYITITVTSNNLPTDTNYWNLIASKGDIGDVSGWSGVPATQDVDFAGFGAAGLSYIILNGNMRTSWPTIGDASTWSYYAATQDVNIANKGLLGVHDMTLGGVNRTNWPDITGDAASWAQYPATTDISAIDKTLTISNIVLNGVSRDTWPWTPVDTNVINNIFYIGSTVTEVGKLYQLTPTGTWEKVINTAVANCNGLIGLALGASSANGILIRGLYETEYTNLVSGDGIYISSSLGTWTTTMPTNNGYVVRQIGYIYSTNQIYIEPDSTYVVIGQYVDPNTSYHFIATQYFGTIVVSNIVGLTDSLQGTAIGGAYTNSVIFDTAFTTTPHIVVTWNDNTIDQLAVPEVIVKNSGGFNWIIRTSAGLVTNAWTIDWLAKE